MTCKVFLVAFLFSLSLSAKTVTVGSKKFAESYILAEVIAGLLESKGYVVDRKLGLGGTKIAYEALVQDEIDIYVEYTGTVSQVILNKSDLNSVSEINSELGKSGLQIFSPLGFNNTYAVATSKKVAEEYGLKKISDLREKKLRAVLSYEFINRADGWLPLIEKYNLKDISFKGIEHQLAYDAIQKEEAELVNAYTTDGKLVKYGFVVLEDDLNFFPRYEGVLFAKSHFDPQLIKVLSVLEDSLSDAKMLEMNAKAQVEGLSFKEVAHEFLVKEKFIENSKNLSKTTNTGLLVKRTLEHLYITFVAILLAFLVALPLGILLQKHPKWSEIVMTFTGLLQTIPSIALLAFMIPLFGIGVKPAIIGLFIYSILPILRNTYIGLSGVEKQYIESARGIGLSGRDILYKIQIPLGLPVIVAGIRTAAVICIGTATLAAFIGAGGLGEFIVTGLALNNTQLILLGAIPSALLAVLVELVFSIIQKRVSWT